MVFKLTLCLPTIFITSNTVAAAVSTGICAVFSVLSLYTTPFVDPYADVMDASGRISTAISVGLGLVASISSPTAGVMGALVRAGASDNVERWGGGRNDVLWCKPQPSSQLVPHPVPPPLHPATPGARRLMWLRESTLS